MSSKNNKKKSKDEITKDMTFSEIMLKRPESAVVLMKAGMHCFGCAMAGGETLEQGCLAHGLDPDKMVLEINKLKEKK